MARVQAHPGRVVAEVLLDQRLVAGFGNLWANELCFLRGLSPWTPVTDVDVPALLRLGARALRHSATSRDGYQVTTGSTARGEQHFVAGRARRPCLRCGTRVRRVDEDGSGPHRAGDLVVPDLPTGHAPHGSPRECRTGCAPGAAQATMPCGSMTNFLAAPLSKSL